MSISEAFQAFRARGQRIGLVPFLPAGFPDLDTTIACLPALEAAGATVIELGFPFSDPIADGPVIQEAFTAALAKRIKVADVFAAVAAARPQLRIPLVSMVSYSIVYRFGLEAFLKQAKAAGFDGLILPDLPPPEAQQVCGRVQAAGLDTILLVSPTTAPDRRGQIARLSSGFVYYLSVSGITGERDRLPADLARQVGELKSLTDRPVCVGFGIHKAEQVAELADHADGAIVGTAYVRRIREHLEEGPPAIASAIGKYTGQLLNQVR